jgi:hypothetical protein
MPLRRFAGVGCVAVRPAAETWTSAPAVALRYFAGRNYVALVEARY